MPFQKNAAGYRCEVAAGLKRLAAEICEGQRKVVAAASAERRRGRSSQASGAWGQSSSARCCIFSPRVNELDLRHQAVGRRAESAIVGSIVAEPPILGSALPATGCKEITWAWSASDGRLGWTQWCARVTRRGLRGRHERKAENWPLACEDSGREDNYGVI